MLEYLRVESGQDQGRGFNILERTTLILGRSRKTDTQFKELKSTYSFPPRSITIISLE
jgi:hypothetical protein